MRKSDLPGGLARWLCAVGLALLCGCESDPVLSPQPDDEEEGGSYGRSVLTTGEAADDPGPPEPNPTVF